MIKKYLIPFPQIKSNIFVNITEILVGIFMTCLSAT